jgi:hypothetical protein
MEASRATGNGTSNAPSTRRTLSRPPHASSLTEAAAGVHRPPGRFRGPVVGVATVRAELAGISPAGVPRQRSRAGPKRTGSNRSPPFMRRGLRKPAPAPGLPRGSPIGGGRSLDWRRIGASSRVGDFTPCPVGVRSPFRLDPEGHSGVPRGRFGARRSDRRLSPSLETDGQSPGRAGPVLGEEGRSSSGAGRDSGWVVWIP